MNKNNDSAFFDQLLGKSESIDIRRLLKALLSRWHWIVLSLLISAVACFLYLKFVKPEYVISVQLKYPGRQSELEDLSSSRTTFIFNSASNDYITEKYNIRSQQVVESALLKMNNPFTFHRIKDFREIDLYPYLPLNLEVLHFEPAGYGHGKFILDEDLSLQYVAGQDIVPLALKTGAVISVPGLVFRVVSVNTAKGFHYEFFYNDPAALANRLTGYIRIEEEEENMPVLEVSFRNHNAAYCSAFLGKLLEAYQEYDLGQKQKSTDMTIRFIEEQVAIFSDSLKAAARDLELFKQRNQVIDVSSSAAEIASTLREFEQEKHELKIRREFITLLENTVGRSFETVNYLSVGLDGTTDNVLVGLLERFNELISKRKEAMLKYSAQAPAVRVMDEELNKYRSQIYDNLSLQKKKNDGAMEIMEENIARLKRRFNQIPGLEKNYLYLQSNFDINKNIHSLLLNKKIESSILRAGILPSFVVITKPDLDKVSPKKPQVLILFTFCGLVAGILFVACLRYLNSRFTAIGQVAAHERVSLAGIVQHFPAKLTRTGKDIATLMADRTVFTESMSALRNRLSFAPRPDGAAGGARYIVVTSDKSGEGKSFITLNLALSFTKIGKKVLVIGADLRKSRLHVFFDHDNKTGLSSYLLGREKDPGALLQHSRIEGLDLIPAGPEPFNPGELLQKPEFKELTDSYRDAYDYIILDTAPVGLVADAIPLFPQADHLIFIIRWLYSDKDAYLVPGRLADEYGVGHVMAVVNDFYPDELHNNLVSGPGKSYGTYGYGMRAKDGSYYTAERKTLWQRIRRIFTKRG